MRDQKNACIYNQGQFNPYEELHSSKAAAEDLNVQMWGRLYLKSVRINNRTNRYFSVGRQRRETKT